MVEYSLFKLPNCLLVLNVKQKNCDIHWAFLSLAWLSFKLGIDTDVQVLSFHAEWLEVS